MFFVSSYRHSWDLLGAQETEVCGAGGIARLRGAAGRDRPVLNLSGTDSLLHTAQPLLNGYVHETSAVKVTTHYLLHR